MRDEMSGSRPVEVGIEDERPGSGYESTIGEMSEKWRQISREGGALTQKSFFEKNYVWVGVGIGIVVIGLLIVIGGVAFLVLNGR